MAYLGNAPVVGDSTNSFRLLDDIASFTVTFDATDTSVVSISGDTLSFTNHRFVTGQKVTYTDGGGTAIGGLTDGTSYFIIKVDQNTIKLATSASNAASSTAINLTSGAAGGSHTLNVKFDGVNTKFKATFNNGRKASISRAGQLSLSINGVVQQPQDTSSPSVGYGVEADSTIVFSTAPVATDVVFGTFIGEVAASFDIEDNTIDNFTGDGSTTIFNLSKEVPSSQDVLVTLDGVTQHPSDASTTRSYSVIDQALTFVSAPATGVAIQARHIGFAGATTSAVTGFYGRTGNAALINTDDISVQNISAGIATFNTIAVGGTVSIGGTLTYEDVTNIDSVGLVTARNGIVVGSGITLSKDGDGFFTGIVTATSFSGSGTNLTGIDTDLVSDTSPQLGGNLDVNTKNIVFGDSSDGSSDDVLIFGAGSDLSLFHNGTDSRIVNTTGDLSIRGDSIKLASTTGEEYFRGTANGSAELFHDNTVMLTTNSDGYRSNDSVKAQFGVGSDLTIYHNGTHNYIDTLANKMHLRVSNGENGIVINSNGAVELYHDNAKQLSTRSDGIEIHAAEGGEAGLYLTADEGDDDNDKYRLVAQNSGDLVFQRHNGTAYSSELRLKSAGGIQANFQGSNKFETSSTGVTVTGKVSATSIFCDTDTDISMDSNPSGQFVVGGNGYTGAIALDASNMNIYHNATARGIQFGINETAVARFDTSGHFLPATNNTKNLGSSSLRWANLYVNDAHFSNEGSTNSVDGTWGDWTLQEGENDIYMINNRSGKKYKFNLTEVS